MPAERWWSSAQPCSPASQFNMCGCCTASAHPPPIASLDITCSDSSLPAEGYTPDVSAANVSAPRVRIASSSPAGAAYGVVTLSQLLHYDTRQASLVLDWVPLTISDSPLLAWRESPED